MEREGTITHRESAVEMWVGNLLCLAALAVALSLPTLSDGAALLVLSAPNLLRVGSNENIFVESQDHAGGPLNVKIMVKNHPTQSKELASKSVVLDQANNFQALTQLVIPEGDHFVDDPKQKQYVVLQAQFPDRLLEKVVLVSFQSGYIFIQTDKTIYTPASTVHYRVFSMTPGLEPLTREIFEDQEVAKNKEIAVSVEIMTPENITIFREIVNPDKGVKSGQFKLPDIVSFGTWHVVTRFQSTPQKTFSSEFEVKEYVLPSFEVSLTPAKAFFYVDDNDLTVDITARYLYGKEVTGTGYVVFGVITTDNEKKSFPASLQRVEIKDGKGVACLKKEHITQTFPKIHDLVKQSIFISVSVLTEGGGEMVEAEKRGIQIVTSPYTILFKRTPKYFKPGMPFDVSVYITNPDNSPAIGVEVEVTPDNAKGVTRANGFAKIPLNTVASATELVITVKTKDPAILHNRQAEATMKALPYRTSTKNFLHVGVDSNELKIGDPIKIDLNLGPTPIQNHDLTYMFLSRGQLVKVGRFKRQGNALVTLSVPVSKELLPSFRIVAYYHVGAADLVADSVWVDIKVSCMGSLKVTSTRPKASYEPRMAFSLTITGDPGAKVGLVAVDKGVYVLNSKHRLTQAKIWDTIEKHDTGCTAGGGADNMGVFYDAGLVFETNTAKGTGIRTDPSCPVSSRRRRAVTISDVITSMASKYNGLAKECCVDGMKDNTMGYTCDRRAQYITDGDVCVQAFLVCCTEMASKKIESKQDALLLSRSEEDDDDAYMRSEDIVSRSQFPESWMWEDTNLPECPAQNKHCESTFVIRNNFLKDSITTWQITAISLSKTHGICVADPFEMIVLKEFFIDLKLPYSAVRNEQLEVKAILHNYSEDPIIVRVELMENGEVCSSASKKGKYRQEVNMDPMSTRVVPYVIIPMKLGLHSIEVKASVKNSGSNDGVKRDLRVVAEGVLVKKETNVLLNPGKHGGEQTSHIPSGVPRNQVPNSDADTLISVTAGEQTSVLVEQAISGDSLGSLIVQPIGCGEQNMIYMTLPVIATHYLDNTKKWEDIGLDKRNTAIKYINIGYQRQLAYRKEDGSYAAWVKRQSSTWLTAYVVKVFAMSSSLISVQENVLCTAVKWLILNTQQPDGIFNEFAPVIHAKMTGNVRGSDNDASMTAFVLIAMQEASSVCEQTVNSLPGSMAKAVAYLEKRLPHLTNPYAVAMSSYALANAGKPNKETLLKFASPQLDHWPVPGGYQYTLEATSYALLALVKVKAFEEAGPIVRWLNKQKKVGGGYGSTQSTIMVFQAVAEYWSHVKDLKDFDLNINLEVAGRASATKWSINNKNQFHTRTDKVNSIDKDLTVKASGNGEATLSVVTLYYALPEEKDSDCESFDLSVTLTKMDKTSHEDAKESFMLTIEVLYKNSERDATMSILDIGLLTGFIVDTDDLNQLSKGRERYIEKFEMDKVLSERGSLILYLDKVSHKLEDRISFKIHRVQEVGVLQPAAVSVYEYYNQKRCVKFYHPQREGGTLSRLCLGDVCTCAEESCSMQKKGEPDVQRIDKACAAGLDYVYKATVVDSKLTTHTDTYTVKIDLVIKPGTDEGVEGKNRDFMGLAYCREALGLMQGKTYMIMGKSEDLHRVEDKGLLQYKYVLGEQTWIEYWPSQQECTSRDYREVCLGIDEFINQITTFGCPV
ncbi:complement C3 [Oncorhynchus tshawytscha]|uniref:Complement C3 n=1 Tax=Oncorhynchus tshawytscha TaxID=74940 RepID=A0A8C8CW98_ONCTS|nr:complement C3 [Oncorhynchus tshawytscha]